MHYRYYRLLYWVTRVSLLYGYVTENIQHAKQFSMVSPHTSFKHWLHPLSLTGTLLGTLRANLLLQTVSAIVSVRMPARAVASPRRRAPTVRVRVV